MADGKRAKPTIDDRTLRVIFNKFDVDGSGAVSATEMSAICKALKLPKTSAEIAALVKEADTSGNGQVEFSEFATALRKQEAGGLAAVVDAGMFGWLNPLNWLGPSEPKGATKKAPKASPKASPKAISKTPSKPTPKASPKPGPKPAIPPRTPPRPQTPPARGRTPPRTPPSRRPRSPPPGRSASAERARPGTTGFYATSPEEIRQSLSDMGISPTHRMKATQGLVQAENRQAASELKRTVSEGMARRESLQAAFLARQQQKVVDTRAQQATRTHAVELLQYQKRLEGWHMKMKHDAAWQEEQVKKKHFAASANQNIVSQKKRKARLTRERHAEAAESSAAASAEAKAERAERREQAKATQRAEEEQARQYTAKVRYETRPELRQEGRDMFQAQREAAVAEVRSHCRRG